MIVCTIAAENYLGKAAYLAASLRRTHPDALLSVCVVERSLHPRFAEADLFDEVVLAESVGASPRFDSFAFRHSVIECSTAIKASYLEYLLQSHPAHETVFYLDPDVEVYSPLQEAQVALEHADIVATPHHIDEAETKFVIATLRTGVCNLGFLALRRGRIAESFLAWWRRRLAEACTIDMARGLFVDQKWFDAALGLFDVKLLREPGYNVAYWNLAQRPLERFGDEIIVGGKPLRFLHFARSDLGHDVRHIRQACPNGTEPMHALRERYKSVTRATKAEWGLRDDWSYDCFASGERIAADTRAACRTQPQLLANCADPYEHSNEYFLSRSIF